MTHYDQLGIDQTATAADIKRAYRNKAREKHPDKGGDPHEFASIGTAYEVLKDPQRRLLYDMTGQDKRLPMEIEVQNVLMNAFGQALSQIEDIEITAFVRDGLQKVVQQIPEESKKLKAREKKLVSKREKVTATGTNVVHMLIDAELKAIAGGLAQLEHQLAVNKACLEALDKYSEEWEAPAEEPIYRVTMFTQSY